MKLLPGEMEIRQVWLFALLTIFVFIGITVLSEVVWTVFLSVIFAYVFYPFKRRLNGKFSERQSAALVTFSAFIALMVLIVPIFFVLFQRRQVLIDFVSSLPDEITLEMFEFSLTYPVEELEVLFNQWVSDTAINIAESLPSLSLKAFLFVFLLYGILKHSNKIQDKVMSITPEAAEEILLSYHERVRKTLVGVFTLQTLTAVMTFFVALPVFYFFGYKAFVSLALISAILQFIPVVGPALVILGLAVLELTLGFTIKALMILIVGFLVIGFLPDAYLRPKFADKATGLPGSLYLIGFIGGLLTLGPIGFLVGPLLIAIILETVDLLAE